MPGTGGGRAAAATRQRRHRAKAQQDLAVTESQDGIEIQHSRSVSRSRSPSNSSRKMRAITDKDILVGDDAARLNGWGKWPADDNDGEDTDRRIPGVQAYLQQNNRRPPATDNGSLAGSVNDQISNNDRLYPRGDASFRKAGDESDDGDNKTNTTEDPSVWDNISSFREFCGMVVNHPQVQFAIIVLIIINALIMGIATFNFVEENDDVQSMFHVLDRIFLVIFTIEISLQLIYLGPMKLLMDPWLVFDAFVVITSWSLESLQIVRAFRIFRAFRLIARLTILRNLANAIFKVLPNMAAISALLSLVLYIYSVLCTVLFHDLYERGLTDEDYFSRLDITFLTLLEIMTLGWAEIVRQVIVVYWWAWMPFVSFILISAFIVYNLVVAVVCDAVTVVEQESKQEELDKEREAEGSVYRGSFDRPQTLREQQERQLQSLQLKVSRMIQTQHTILQSLESTMLELEAYPESTPTKRN